jgi:hypothetical protein
MQTFNIIKKNRKYFAAKLGKYPCKILIDSRSESLTTGEHALEVDDISVRSKYGIDLIFKLKADLAVQAAAGICTLRTKLYNKIMVEECRNLGGKWDKEQGAWIFSGIVSEEVEILDERYNSSLIAVELTAVDDIGQHNEAVSFLGYTLATAYGRDSGAKLADGVALIRGQVGSGGSMKNWRTVVESGTVLRMELPKLVLDSDNGDSGFNVKIIG